LSGSGALAFAAIEGVPQRLKIALNISAGAALACLMIGFNPALSDLLHDLEVHVKNPHRPA